MLNACKPNGSLTEVDRLAAALTESDYQQLTSFAARRLRCARAGCSQGDRIVVEPSDLVHQAVLKALLGGAGFPGGWHLRPADLATPQTFRRALQSIINSTAIALAKRSEYRTDHVPVGNPVTEPGAVEPETRLDTRRHLELRDLREAVFQELREKAAGHPERQRLIERWESAFLTDYQLPKGSDSRQRRRHLRSQIQKVLQKLGREIISNTATGKEILL